MPVQNRSTASIIAVLTGGLVAVYWLPYFFPERDGLSFSYMFGFNNRAATVLLAIFILGFAIWTGGLGLRPPGADARPPRRFRRTGFVAIAVVVAGCGLVWLLNQPFIVIDEAQYFLDRYEMFRQGRQIFRGFEFDYGPLMFYPAVWIARLTGVSLVSGYYLAWIGQWGLGTWLLGRTVARAAGGTRHGRAIFLLLWGFFLTAIMDSGANYTPLRFCLTLAFALAVERRFARGDSNFATFGLAACGAVAALFYSPEQGIVFTAATTFYFAVCVRPVSRRAVMGVCGFLLAVAPAFWLAGREGALNNIRTVGQGALNLPLLPTFQTIVLLLLLVAAGCATVASLRDRTARSPLLYLICISLVSAPAAFSRADVGHIVINMLGALMVAMIVLSQYPALWRWTWPAFALVILCLAYSHYETKPGFFRDQIRQAAFGRRYRSPWMEEVATAYLMHRYSRDEALRLIANRRSYADWDYDPDAPRLPDHAFLFAPLGVSRRLRPFDGDPQIVTGYYPWLLAMTSTSMIPFKIAELEQHPDWPLLLPARENLSCVQDPAAARQYLKQVLLAPYMPPVRHRLTAAEPFCDYLRAYYAPSVYTSPAPQSYIWIRKGEEAPHPLEH